MSIVIPLKTRGGTAEEWAHLEQSYRALGRWAEARDAYTEAVKSASDDVALLRDYTVAVGEADGETSPAHGTALRQLRDHLPMDSTERAAIEERLKTFK